MVLHIRIKQMGQVMRLVSDIFERLPMVWLLLGLLFFATGLYLGFDYKLTFVYLMVGAVCSLYGLLLFIFLRRENPKRRNPSPLSRNFISAGSTVIMPASAETDGNEGARQGGAS